MKPSEITFRAWDKDDETMVYSDGTDNDYWFSFDKGKLECLVNCEYCDSFGDEHDDWKPLDNIMQYTGSKDKHKNKIYDCDILHVIEKGRYGGEYYVTVKWIHWNDRHSLNEKGTEWSFYGCMCFEAKEVSHHEEVNSLFTRGFITRTFGSCIQLCEMTNRDNFEIEVVGNICENLDLVK